MAVGDARCVRGSRMVGWWVGACGAARRDEWPVGSTTEQSVRARCAASLSNKATKHAAVVHGS